MTTLAPDLRPLATLPGDARRHAEENGLDAAALDAVHYRDLLNGAISGRILAERIKNRWHHHLADVPHNAAALGVRPRAAA